jgi:hypothetical protein
MLSGGLIHVACTGDEKCIQKFILKTEGNDQLEDLGVEGRI